MKIPTDGPRVAKSEALERALRRYSWALLTAWKEKTSWPATSSQPVVTSHSCCLPS